jgi:threonine dehydratase
MTPRLKVITSTGRIGYVSAMTMLEAPDGDAASYLDIASGARFVSAYNDRWVIAGQAGVAIEVERSLRAECTIVAPIGGGGLAAGIAIWAAARPGLEVVGVEAAASASVTALLQGGDVAAAASGVTIADGLAGGIEPGAVTVDILGRHLADLVTVTENEIRDAMRFLVREHGLVVEPAGAVSVAAILAGKVARRDGQRLVAVLSGRNVTPELLVAILGEPGESGSA